MKVTITLEKEWDILTFAQFLKRITYGGVADCAVDKEETEKMIEIIENIRGQLAKQGFSPR